MIDVVIYSCSLMRFPDCFFFSNPTSEPVSHRADFFPRKMAGIRYETPFVTKTGNNIAVSRKKSSFLFTNIQKTHMNSLRESGQMQNIQ